MTESQQTPVALVTGASRGIGLAVAQSLARDGYHAVLVSRTRSATEAAAEGIRGAGGRASAIACDLADRNSVAELIGTVTADFGRLDVLVNNAGALQAAQLAEAVEYAEWDRMLELNVTTPWYLASRLRPLMPEGSVVVNVASTASYYPSRGLVAYNVSKAAQLMLTRVLALEWARNGVRVVGVAPGKIETDLLAPIKAYAERRNQELNPQRRIGRPDEVAGLVSYLVSPAAAFLTGTIVTIDGGELLVAGSTEG